MCYGNQLEDLMYCPNEKDTCGQTDITVGDKDEGRNISIISNVFNPLCIYQVSTVDKGVIDVEAESWITVIDPDTIVQECLITPCNLTTSTVENNDLYIIS